MITTLIILALSIAIIIVLQLKNRNLISGLRRNQSDTNDTLNKLVKYNTETSIVETDNHGSLYQRRFDISELSISELIQGDKLNASIAEDRIGLLNSILPETFNGIVQSTSYLAENDTYLVEFSKKGRELLSSEHAVFAKKGNKFVPQLKVNGKYFEHAQLAGRGKDVIRVLSKVSALAVSAAHIISGADLAKKLNEINGKLDLIIEDRTNELYSELEAILKYAIELKLLDDDEYSKNELRRLSKDIYKLRARWKLRLISRLNRIENEHDVSWIKKFFSREKTRDKKMLNKLSQGQEEILMVKASINLQLALAEERGETEIFLKKILPAELKELNEVGVLLEEKSEFINDKFESDGISAELVKDDFNNVIEQFKMLTYDEVHVDEIEILDSTEKELIEA